jgi:hypothetical protein
LEHFRICNSENLIDPLLVLFRYALRPGGLVTATQRRSGDKFLVVSTSSTIDPLPEPVEGSSGDFDLLPSLMGEGSGVGLLVAAKEKTYKVNICYLI